MMANEITGLRILVSVVLVFCPVYSPIFYVLYLIAGLSDMVDGIIDEVVKAGANVFAFSRYVPSGGDLQCWKVKNDITGEVLAC